jgi:hypothetical protein
MGLELCGAIGGIGRMEKDDFYQAIMVGTRSCAFVSSSNHKMCAIEYGERAFVFYLNNFPHFALDMSSESPECMKEMVFNWMAHDKLPPLDKVLWFH